ncbi:MAG: heterodisulfide reductase-related iron-sulfur binding cluster [Actinomycetota bacterium]|nr:heterodisulfide reductase-related iron-sulfur binding cluster [Actinomycetota bacterium]
MSDQRPDDTGAETTQETPDQAGEGAPQVTTAPQEQPWSGVFDPHHPPQAELIDDCVHCGFCLPTCPTYALWGEEMDSPRGRIWLMKLGLEGEVEMNDTFVRHLDACLGCMACVTACPSGVQYDKLIEDTRAQIERNYERSRADELFRQLVFALFPHPRRLRAASLLGWAYQRTGMAAAVRRWGVTDRLPPRLRALESLMPDVGLRTLGRTTPTLTEARGQRRRRVGLLTGCVQRVFFSDVNAATARVLAAEGCEVYAPRSQECCGALMVHAGQEAQALDKARAMIDVFEGTGVDTIVVNAAGCGSTMKEYGWLLRDDERYAERARAFSDKVRDVTEVLAALETAAPRHPIAGRVAYHDACHLAHAQDVRGEPRSMLSTIPGLELLAIPEPEICCGSAGIYNLVEPEAAEDLGRRKADNIASTGPDAVATANPGCLLQIRRHMSTNGQAPPLFHPIELVDASIRGVDPLR